MGIEKCHNQVSLVAGSESTAANTKLLKTSVAIHPTKGICSMQYDFQHNAGAMLAATVQPLLVLP